MSGVARVLHVVAVDAEGRETFLGVCRKHSGQVDRAGTLGAVESPHRFGRERVHVHRFRAVAPGRGYCDVQPHALLAELIGCHGGFGHATDTGIGDNAHHGLPVGVAQVRAQQVGSPAGLAHCLLFQRLAHAAPASVNGRSYADSRPVAHIARSGRARLCIFVHIELRLLHHPSIECREAECLAYDLDILLATVKGPPRLRAFVNHLVESLDIGDAAIFEPRLKCFGAFGCIDRDAVLPGGSTAQHARERSTGVGCQLQVSRNTSSVTPALR